MSVPLALLLLACSGDGATGPGKEGGGDDTSGPADTHPLVPDAYADAWDVESRGGEDATVYWAFTGAIDAAGALSGEETWYWFFPEAGWDADCADTFDVTAVEEPTPIADDACNSCDRDFTAAFVLNEDKRNCPFDGYESLLDNDTTDRIDEEAYTLALMLDTDPLGGEPGETSVWSYAQDDRDADTWIQRAVSAGMFAPDVADETDGPGTLTWARSEGLCVTIEEQ